MKIQYPKDYVVWDLETTGFDAPECKILEIGAMVFENHKLISTHHWVLNHKIEIPQNIIEITGITREIVEKEGRDPVECLLEFDEIITSCGAHLTHNGIKFDIPFYVTSLKHHLNMSDDDALRDLKSLNARAIDTAVLYKAHKLKMMRTFHETFKSFADRVMRVFAKGVKYNVGVCCDELGVDRSSVTQHRALGDVELTQKIYQKFIDQN